MLLTAVLAVACQGSGESSVGPLQAVKYIPQQGDAVVTYKDNTEESRMTLAFEISPKEYITTLVKVWQQTVSCAVQCDNQTIQLEIQSLRSSVEMGKISMTISCGALPETFFAEQSAATAMVHIADGDNVISSESIALSVKREVKPEQIVFQKYAKENELKVMSFNVRVGSNWTSRQEACVALIIDQQPCVIGFQEAAYSAQWLYLKEQLKENYDGWGVNRDTGKESGSGEVMGILYNKSKLEKMRVVHSGSLQHQINVRMVGMPLIGVPLLGASLNIGLHKQYSCISIHTSIMKVQRRASEALSRLRISVVNTLHIRLSLVVI